MLWIFLLLLLVPLAELYVIIQVWEKVGGLETIALLLIVSVAGAWLVRREGTGVLQRINAQLAAGNLPTNELVDGGLILFAGALMLTPGFITDAVGLLLLIPPTRAGVRALLKRRFGKRMDVYASQGGVRFVTFSATGRGPSGSDGSGPGFGPGPSRPRIHDQNEVIDVDGWEEPPEPGPSQTPPPLTPESPSSSSETLAEPPPELRDDAPGSPPGRY